MEPVCILGEKLEIEWPMDDGSFELVEAEVVGIRKSKKTFKYSFTFEFFGTSVTQETRLLHLKWSRMVQKKKKRKHDEDRTEGKAARKLPDYRFILAPMVGGSELAFRLLCRRYGTTLAYTPMMNSELFAVDETYRSEQFQSTPADRPVVAHFSGNNPAVMLAAAKHVEFLCDAIDLNLGCPQRIAHAGHYGSFLLGEEDRPLIISIVKNLSENISLPIFVKIRLLDSVPQTIELCRQLISAGASLIAIHARYRVNLVGRTGPGARDGAAHLDQIREIKAVLAETGVAIISNGNVRCWEDVEQNRAFTGADGIMSAEGILDNPALFAPNSLRCGSSGGNTMAIPSKVGLAQEYLALVDQYPVKLKSVIFHVRRICRDELVKYQMMDQCVEATSVEEVQRVVDEMAAFEKTGVFVADAGKIQRAKEAAERRKREEGKRKAFEERMLRKAKREGKESNFYLSRGSAVPTIDELSELKAMPKDKSFELWKSAHGQHCFVYHFDPQRCPRERTCSFLHMDPSLGDEALAFG